MFFSLSETVIYQTTQSPKSIAYSFNAEIDSAEIFRFWGSSKKYEGIANEYLFSIHRIPHSKSTYFAQAEGAIRQEKGYTVVEVQLDMPIILKIFISIGLGLSVFCFLISFLLPSEDNMATAFRYIPATLFFTFFFICLVSYKWQAYSLKYDLKEILRANIVEQERT